MVGNVRRRQSNSFVHEKLIERIIANAKRNEHGYMCCLSFGFPSISIESMKFECENARTGGNGERVKRKKVKRHSEKSLHEKPIRF